MSDLTTEQAALFADVIEMTETRIAELERAIKSGLNRGRYVVLMGGNVNAACKSLGSNTYNFSAMGVDALTLSPRGAELQADFFRKERGQIMEVMQATTFYRDALDAAKESLAFYKEHMAK